MELATVPWHRRNHQKIEASNLQIKASHNRSNSAFVSDSVGSIINAVLIGQAIVGEWKPIKVMIFDFL